MKIDVTVDGLTHRLDVDKEPTEADVTEIATSLRQQDAFAQHEQANGLPSGMLRAIAKTESGFNPQAKSKTGVRGLMQFTKATGKQYGLTAENFLDPEAQVAAAGRFMKDNLAAANGDVRTALARYGDPKQADYADLVLKNWEHPQAQPQAPSGGGVLGPQEAAAAEGPPDPAAAFQARAGRPPSALERTVLGLPPVPEGQPTAPRSILGTAFYRTVGRMLSAGNALAYNLGEPGVVPPEKFAGVMRGSGFPNIPAQAPTSTLGAAVETAGGALGLATAPAAPVFTAAAWGLPTLLQYATDSEQSADLLEAGIGAGALARDAVRLGGAFYRTLRVPTSVTEYRAALGEAGAARTVARDAARAADAEKAAAAAAESRVTAAAEAHETALRSLVDEAPSTMPTQEVRYVTGLPPEQQLPTAAGRGELLQESLPQRAAQIAKQRQAAYVAAEAHADSLGVGIPFLSGISNEIRDTGTELHKVLVEAGGTLTERKLALELANLGGEVSVNPVSGEMIVRGGAGEDVPYSKLSKLYARMRNIGLNPREYPTSNDRADKVFSLLTTRLGQALHELELSDPKLTQLGAEARRIVRDVEVPYRQTSQRVLKASATPVTAAKATVTLPATVRDSTHIKRILMMGSPAEKEAMLHGLWADLEEAAEDRFHNVDLEKYEKLWTKVPEDVKNLMSMSSERNAAASVNEMFARRRQLDALATQSRAASETTLEALKATTAESKTATVRMNRAIADMAASQRKADVLARRAGKMLTRPAYGHGRLGGMFGYMHAVGAVASAIHGNLGWAGFHAWRAYMMLKRPLLLAEALRTPAETFAGARITAALAATMRSWNGLKKVEPPSAAGAGTATVPPGVAASMAP